MPQYLYFVSILTPAGVQCRHGYTSEGFNRDTAELARLLELAEQAGARRELLAEPADRFAGPRATPRPAPHKRPPPAAENRATPGQPGVARSHANKGDNRRPVPGLPEEPAGGRRK